MLKVPVTVDNLLRLDGNLIGHDLADLIFDELTIPNNAHEEARVHGRHGWWDIPESFQMAYLDGDTVVMPRGYALRLKQLLREYDKRVVWIDERTWRVGKPYGPEEFTFRSHQPAAIEAMWHFQQGIYKAPTGSGKTVAIIGFLWEHTPARSLIIVERLELLNQWVNRVKEHLGIEAGVIGNGKWIEKRITVATAQTLHRHIDRLREEHWFRKHSALFIDECHHATARTLNELIQEFPARIRVGASATPDKTGEFELALNVMGDIIHEDDEEELIDMGLIVKPHVEVVHTDFEHVFWGTHSVKHDEYCDVPGCKKSGIEAHSHRDNYQKVKQALVIDDRRNAIIADEIASWDPSCQIIITSEVKHIDAMMDVLRERHPQLYEEGVVFKVIGKGSKKKRAETIAQLEGMSRFILFSTVAAEGLDIKQIDAVHLPFPEKNVGAVKQKIGRGTRTSDGKEGAVVIDYADVLVPPFAKHFRERRWKVYEPLGLEVVIRGVTS